MRYVHEFVDEMACMRCPHNAPATEENGWEGFDYVCYAREDGDEFLFPEECPTYFGPWGAWRAVGREVSWRAEVISEMSQEYDTDRLNLGALFVSLGMYIEIRICLDAVGWSP